MKYFSRLGIYKASNVSFNPDTCQAYSYGWWRFVDCINGKVVFNDYSYSNSTNKHQSKVRNLLAEQDIKIDLFVKVHCGLDGRERGGYSNAPTSSKEVLKLAAENAYLQFFEASIKNERARTPNTYQIEEAVKTFRGIYDNFKIKLSLKRIAELKKQAVKNDEYNRKQKRERAKAKREKLAVQKTQTAELTERGFSPVIGYNGEIRIRCADCNPSLINGIACHEQGCPNMKRHLSIVNSEEQVS